jgi:hypothetical protein
MRIATWALAFTVLALSGCAMTSSPTSVTGRDGSQPSALPSPTPPDAARPETLFERYPELEIQAR